MKKIIFIRHAKAEEEAGFSDFERSLTAGGKKVSREMAGLFKLKEKAPGLFISSPAFRALETALIFAGRTGYEYDKVLLYSRLYFNTSLDNLMDMLAELDENVSAVTLFGHNPSFSEIADTLCEKGCEFLPKTGIACISFDVAEWSGVKKKSGKLEYLLKPEK